MQEIALKDINGKECIIPFSEIYKSMQRPGVLLFGMDMETIIQLRHQYLLRGGQINMTPETVKAIFKREE